MRNPSGSPSHGAPALLHERATGIEPAFSAWEADVLPLNYARGAPRTLPKVLVSGGPQVRAYDPRERHDPGVTST
jgi:hypothetical protein